MMKYIKLIALCLLIIFWCACDAQNSNYIPTVNANPQIKDVPTSYVPNRITRNITQDRNGNIWIASWDGVFRYDGKSFTNITKDISSARFFDVLEDRKGNLWLSTIGSGVYHYDGKSFRNFTTFTTGLLGSTSRSGLGNNRISCIYEDKKTGNIWFGSDRGGASLYDGRSFQHFTTNDGLPENSIASITADKTGKLWFATGNNACVYDGKEFTVIKNEEGKPIKAIYIIADRNGSIWLGCKDGLWRYDGKTFTNLSKTLVGYIIEDSKGNIWTTGESDNHRGMALSRYEVNASFKEKTTVLQTGAPSKINLGLFGIFEDANGNIWFGASDGVYRYDGTNIASFRDQKIKE